jgi:hypothetical protein
MNATKQLRTVVTAVVAALVIVGLGVSSAGAAELATAERETAVTQPSAQVASGTVVAYGCPAGWVARPSNIASALGPCVPGSLIAVLWELAPPDGCPSGWVPRSPVWSSALGPCVPGSLMLGSSDPTG